MNLEQEIREIISEVLDNDEIYMIDEEEDLIAHGLDSMFAMEIVVRLEVQYGISIEDDDLLLDNLSSIKKLIHLVDKHTSGGKANEQ